MNWRFTSNCRTESRKLKRVWTIGRSDIRYTVAVSGWLCLTHNMQRKFRYFAVSLDKGRIDIGESMEGDLKTKIAGV